MLVQIQQIVDFIVMSIKKLLALSAGVKLEILDLSYDEIIQFMSCFIN